jgi:hypothetical protein
MKYSQVRDINLTNSFNLTNSTNPLNIPSESILGLKSLIMFFKILLVTLPVLMPLALGGKFTLFYPVLFFPLITNIKLKAPANPAVDTDSLLAPRGGNYQAVLWSNTGCSGTNLLTQVDFGCGGTCYQVSNANSIALSQDTTGGKKPTANLYSDSNCETFIVKAGILSGNHDGCTNTPYPVNSVYLYFGC